MKPTLSRVLAAVLISSAAPAAAQTAPAPAPEPAPAPAPDPAPAVPVEPTPAADLTVKPVATPAPEAATDDFDLASLGLDPNAAAFDDKLQIYGFADFTYLHVGAVGAVVPTTSAFTVGNLNIYLKKNLARRWRSLAEVRMLFTPNGSGNLVVAPYTSTATTDPANEERPIHWGGISIERAYVEYDATSWLTVRAGHFLTPYGIWNIDHGSPVIISVGRPYEIGEELFPQHQTGIEVFGTHRVGDYGIEYHATVSNGRNPYEATRDPDRKLGIGGRFAVEAPWAGTFRAGVSAYSGTALEESGGIYKELALGADVSWNHGGFHAQGELLSQQRVYDEGHRAPGQFGFEPDGRAWGAYALAGYRFDAVWNAMPYAVFEHYVPYDPTFLSAHTNGVTAGINLRPTPTVVLKAEVLRGMFGGDFGYLAGRTLDLARVQCAWVF
ncbi:hypothetical protein BH11MYX2_BH11MYX2_36370 [soil metagenome]